MSSCPTPLLYLYDYLWPLTSSPSHLDVLTFSPLIPGDYQIRGQWVNILIQNDLFYISLSPLPPAFLLYTDRLLFD